MSHQRAFQAYGARLDQTRAHGAKVIGIDQSVLESVLTKVATLSRQHGGDITKTGDPWRDVYLACADMNKAIMTAQFQLGRMIDPKGPPPSVGPSFFLT